MYTSTEVRQVCSRRYLYTATLKRCSAASAGGAFRMAEGRAFRVLSRPNGKDRCRMSARLPGWGLDNWRLLGGLAKLSWRCQRGQAYNNYVQCPLR